MGAAPSDHPAPPSTTAAPVFAIILLGGPLSGAMVRDIRLANELVTRGFRVHVWWTMDRPRESPLDERIEQHWLFSGLRYAGIGGRGLGDTLGRMWSVVFSDKNRSSTGQNRPRILQRVMNGLMQQVADGVEQDTKLIDRFAREMTDGGVTHVLPMLAVLAPWVDAARQKCPAPPRLMVTFQGYELYVSYARAIGCEEQVYARMRDAVERSEHAAIAVSEDYLDRVVEEVGVSRERLVAIPPGVPVDVADVGDDADAIIRSKFSAYDPGRPLITYLGRQDTEKGIDLLLYAAAILRRRGMDFQLAICGPTLFGGQYKLVCRQLAQDLRCGVLWRNRVSNEVRTALFTRSRCVVYPSIHREPFGMVAAETMAHGTPAIVPDYGGIAGAIEAAGEAGGLHFRIWDSGDLADKIGMLLTDDDLYERLSTAAPRVAAYFSVSLLADRVLNHLRLPRTPGLTPESTKAGMASASDRAMPVG